MWSFIPAIAKGLFGLGGQYMDNKRADKKQKHELKAAVTKSAIDRAKEGNLSAAELDKISLSDRGWKDEYLLIITTLPVILSFFPSMVTDIQAGFAALETMPEYYWYALAMIYIDTLGFRRMLRTVIAKYMDKAVK
jgi:hypothetical protein